MVPLSVVSTSHGVSTSIEETGRFVHSLRTNPHSTFPTFVGLLKIFVSSYQDVLDTETQ